MRGFRRERLLRMVGVLESGPKKYDDLMKVLGLSFTQLDGDRVVLQSKNLVDVKGRNWHIVVLKQSPVTADQLERLFPSVRREGADGLTTVDEVFEMKEIG